MSLLNVCRFCGSEAIDQPPIVDATRSAPTVLGFVGCSSLHNGKKARTSKCYVHTVSTDESYEKAVEKWNEANPYKNLVNWAMNCRMEDL